MSNKQNADFLARLQSRQSDTQTGSRYSTSQRPPISTLGTRPTKTAVPPPRTGALPPLPGRQQQAPSPGFLGSSLSGRNLIPSNSNNRAIPPPQKLNQQSCSAVIVL